MLETDRIIGKLEALAQLDYDAVQAYDKAIDTIEETDAEIHRNLSLFRDDHRSHIVRLRAAIRTLGGAPKELSRDVKGAAIEGMTALMSATGTKAALKAMRSNEKLTNKTYAAAIHDNNGEYASYPPGVKTMLKEHYADEQRHLNYINSALNVVAAAPAGSR